MDTTDYSAFSVPITPIGPINQYLHTNLVPGSEHIFSVYATNSEGDGPASDDLVIFTADGLPAQPPPIRYDFYVVGGVQYMNINVQPAAYSGVHGGTITRYELEEDQSATLDTWITEMLNVSTVTLLSIRVRSSTQNYKYRVRAVNSNGVTGPYSASVVVPNDISGLPTSPSNVTFDAGSITPTTVRVRWQIPLLGKNENATFQVRLYPINGGGGGGGGGNSTRRLRMRSLQGDGLGDGVVNWFASWESCTASIATYACTAVVEGAQPDTFYNARVLTENAQGASLLSAATYDSQVMMPPGAPDRPTAILVAARSTTSLTISWGVPPDNGQGIVGYLVTYGVAYPTGPTQAGSPLGTSLGLRGSDASALPSLSSAASCADVVAGLGSNPPASPAEGAGLSYLIIGLTPGTSYQVRVEACNGIPRAITQLDACVCAGDACPVTPDEDPLPGAAPHPVCASAPTPAHTKDQPVQPDAPIDDPNPNLESMKTQTLFITWDAPFAHYLPLLDVQLSTVQAGTSDISVADLPPTATAFNLTDLMPATQYEARVRYRNEIGWSEWSAAGYLSTIPDVPGVPQKPLCDEVRSTESSVYVGIRTANPHGAFIQRYEVQVAFPHNGTVLYTAQVDAGRTPLALDVLRADVLTYSNYLLTHTTPYNVTVRARNSLGWGPWSEVGDDCATTPPYVPPFPWLLLVIPLLGLVLLLIVCMIVWKCTDLPKILAPSLRRVEEKDDPLEDYIVKEDTPMEDFDPELTINPVILAKMEFEKRQKQKRRGKGAGPAVWRGGPGALARLNFRIDAKKSDEPPGKRGLKNIDMMIAHQDAPEGGSSSRSGREASRRPAPAPKEDKDFGRTMTMFTAQKNAKTRKFAAERQVAAAKRQQCAASKRQFARAAARMPGAGPSIQEEPATETL